MNKKFENSDETAGAGSGKLPNLLFRKAFGDLQWCCSAFAHNLTHLPLFDPNPSSFKTHIINALSTVQSHAKHALDAGMTNWCLNYRSSDSQRNPAIEEPLGGVPVYALSNGAEEFVLVSGASTGKDLGLFLLQERGC